MRYDTMPTRYQIPDTKGSTRRSWRKVFFASAFAHVPVTLRECSKFLGAERAAIHGPQVHGSTSPRVHKLPGQPNLELGLHQPTSKDPQIHRSTSYPHNQIRSWVCTDQEAIRRTLTHKLFREQTTQTIKTQRFIL